MASSNPKSAGTSYQPQSSDDSDNLMAEVDSYKADFKEMMERSLTNLNIHISAVSEQVEELTKSYQEFSANFIKQQEMIMQEVKMLRIDSAHIRKDMAAYVEKDD